MFLSSIKFPTLYFAAPTDGPADAGKVPSSNMDKDDVIKFLGDDDIDEDKELIDLDEKKDKKLEEGDDDKSTGKSNKDRDKVDGDDEPDEVDELKELEEDLEEPTDEQLELVTPVRRKEILAKYPKLFKDFPYLEKAYYREQQFTELLPTIEDAKEAVEKSQTLDNFERDLLGGDTEKILTAMKTEAPKSFAKMVDNYMTTLAKVDEKAYTHVIGNTIRHTIMAMVSEGRRSNNEALQNAAQILNQFVFASSEFTPPSKLSADEKPEDDKTSELTRREQEFARNQFQSVNSEINTRVNNSFRATIEANIDPRTSMTDYVKKNACREALENLNELISKDTRFKTLVDKLWRAAINDNYSKTSVERIRSAFSAKAKTLLPAVIKGARNEALRGMGKRVNNDTKDKDDTPRKGQNKEQSRSNNSDRNKSTGVPQGMSTLEFLMKDDD